MFCAREVSYLIKSAAFAFFLSILFFMIASIMIREENPSWWVTLAGGLSFFVAGLFCCSAALKTVKKEIIPLEIFLRGMCTQEIANAYLCKLAVAFGEASQAEISARIVLRDVVMEETSTPADGEMLRTSLEARKRDVERAKLKFWQAHRIVKSLNLKVRGSR